ncbi:hypothetical protein AB0O34_33305 [Sphaerisporangium sp. NPDC088356]|uniref:hypothetical protein n=1 Tax=Sphaerisporangium sp. NPDC088356 TaxID=3154871 RepID=UPI003445A32A
MSASQASRLLATATLMIVPALPVSFPVSPATATTAPPSHAATRACGTPDLAVAAPYDTVNGRTRVGTVTLFHGTSKETVLSQGTPGVADTPERGDSFRSSVVAGDLFSSRGSGDHEHSA